MQCSGSKVRSVWPNECVDFAIDLNLVEQAKFTQWTVQLTSQHRLKVDDLLGVIVKAYPKRVIRNDFEGPDLVDWMLHTNKLAQRINRRWFLPFL